MKIYVVKHLHFAR